MIQTGVYLYPGVVESVTGTDGSNEAPPEQLSFVITYWVNGKPYRATAVQNAWRLHDDTIDGVSVKVYPIKPGTPVLVWKSPQKVYALFPERIALRACPEA
jgi:hypothetical protein